MRSTGAIVTGFPTNRLVGRQLADYTSVVIWCQQGWREMMENGSESESIGRSRIFQAAYPLFVEHGYKSVSMQEIADDVPINKATLYHHFRNKDAIFLAVVRASLKNMRDQVEATIERGGTAQEQFVAIAATMFENTRSDLGRLMTDVHEYLPMDDRLDLMRDDANPWDLYEAIFTTAIERGELPETDARTATSMFIGLIYGQTWSRKIGRIDTPLDKQVAVQIVETLFGGLRNQEYGWLMQRTRNLPGITCRT